MVRIIILMLLTTITACTTISHDKPKFGRPTEAPRGYKTYKP